MFKIYSALQKDEYINQQGVLKRYLVDYLLNAGLAHNNEMKPDDMTAFRDSIVKPSKDSVREACKQNISKIISRKGMCDIKVVPSLYNSGSISTYTDNFTEFLGDTEYNLRISKLPANYTTFTNIFSSMLNNVNIDEMLNNIYFNTLQHGMHYLNSLNMYALLMYIYRNKRNYVVLDNSYDEYLFFKKCDVHTAINYRCYYIIDKRYIQLFNLLSKKSSSAEILHALGDYASKLDYESLLIEGTCLRVERVGDRYILTSMGNTYNLISLLLLNYIKHYRNSAIFNDAFKMSAGEYNSSVLNYITDVDTIVDIGKCRGLPMTMSGEMYSTYYDTLYHSAAYINTIKKDNMMYLANGIPKVFSGTQTEFVSSRDNVYMLSYCPPVVFDNVPQILCDILKAVPNKSHLVMTPYNFSNFVYILGFDLYYAIKTLYYALKTEMACVPAYIDYLKSIIGGYFNKDDENSAICRLYKGMSKEDRLLNIMDGYSVEESMIQNVFMCTNNMANIFNILRRVTETPSTLSDAYSTYNKLGNMINLLRIYDMVYLDSLDTNRNIVDLNMKELRKSLCLV